MKGYQVLSGEVLDKMEAAFKRGNHWVLIQTTPHLLEPADIQCFASRELALDYQTYVEEEGPSDLVPIHSLLELLSYVSGKLPNYSFLKNTIMNEKNLSYLQDNLKYLGFGDKLNDALLSQIGEGKPSFTISFHSEFNRQPLEALLHFKKSEQSGMYFFNKYEATLRHPSDPTLDRQASFFINKGTGVTLKEAFNLLNGRAVNKDFTTKEGQSYNAWIQLDLKQKDPGGQYSVHMYHERYGFDLEKTVMALPIKELKEPEQKEALLKSLQKGNLQSVSFLTAKGEEKRFIEAAPQFKTLNQYDEHLSPILHHSSQQQLTAQTQVTKKNSVAEPGEEGSLENDQKRKNKKGLSI